VASPPLEGITHRPSSMLSPRSRVRANAIRSLSGDQAQNVYREPPSTARRPACAATPRDRPRVLTRLDAFPNRYRLGDNAGDGLAVFGDATIRPDLTSRRHSLSVAFSSLIAIRFSRMA
jgi:hypothetical protein